MLAAPADSIAPTVVFMVLISGGTIFGLGYAVAVMHRANADYKDAKAGLPGKRKDYWRAWWSSAKRGFLIFCGLAFLIVWMVNSR